MILLLDNYDSFTYNIYQIVAENFPDTIVCRNDEINIQKIKELNPDKIIISPGPSHPKNSGICKEVVESLGASSMKDMGKIMGSLKQKYSDSIDFSKVNLIVKGLLSQ